MCCSTPRRSCCPGFAADDRRSLAQRVCRGCGCHASVAGGIGGLSGRAQGRAQRAVFRIDHRRVYAPSAAGCAPFGPNDTNSVRGSGWGRVCSCGVNQGRGMELGPINVARARTWRKSGIAASSSRRQCVGIDPFMVRYMPIRKRKAITSVVPYQIGRASCRERV